MADDYTPTTEEIREFIEAADRVVSSFAPGSAAESFDRWLAAHDAEKRSEWEAEQGTEEPEWEYGAQHSQGTNPHPSRKRAEEMVAWHAAGDERKRPEARGKSKLVRRRKAGPWEAVPAAESTGQPRSIPASPTREEPT